jgi:hypothetical protein
MEQFNEAGLISITHWTFAIRLDPFGMLDPEIVMDLLPEFAVVVGLVGDTTALG